MDSLDILKIKEKDLNLYAAGSPHFLRNFSRDSLISGILMQNPEMIKDQLIFCAKKQGKKKDPITGEEPGKIFHEYPGVNIKGAGFLTTYNACDTTALYLIAHKTYFDLTKDKSLSGMQIKNIKQATNYILAHVKNGFFIESPKFCDAKKFALRNTYWKDSEIINRENGTPKYPVIYTLAHIQNLAGLRAAYGFLKDKKIKESIENMIKNLKRLYDKKLGMFYIAIDKLGPIKGISSDSLHALFYLSPKDLPKKLVKEIVKSSDILESSIGYKATNTSGSKYGGFDYSLQVWPFEQAIIHAGAKKFKLQSLMKISSKIFKYLKKLKSYPELLIISKNKIIKKGCDPQLWTIAAENYFLNKEKKIFYLINKNAPTLL